MDSKHTVKRDELRQSVLEKRTHLNVEMGFSLGVTIQERVLKSAHWKGPSTMGFYSAARNEVETKLLFMNALEQGVTAYFPRVEQGLQFYEVGDPTDLQKGAWGLLEPKHGCKPLPDLAALDLVFVPGIVFDLKGHRLGYGKGFYDMFLEHFPNKTIGLAYEFQLVDEIPAESWDQRLQYLMTEKKEYEFIKKD